MFSYSKVSRWLTFACDPITVEDWVANREIFGLVKNPDKKDEELERAYQLEKLHDGKLGFFETPEMVLAVLEAVGEAWIYGSKVERLNLAEGEMVTKELPVDRPIRIKVKLANKKMLEWKGQGKQRVIFDLQK